MARVVGRPRFLSAFFIFPSMVFFFLRADEFPGLGMYGASSPISSSLAPRAEKVRYALDGGNRLGGVNEVVVAR